ncbi:Glycogen synthase, ADP-glucose transglucosylase [hydrothermal vent metagenome]|uniref:starch synthase n=1 Tax=hydrothermal vent metagenome TaxID=652676 RepID=A0A3B1CRU6_9ZZZZ
MGEPAKGPPLNIVIVSSEAVPYAKTGGLADVAGALPTALAEIGHNVSLFIPFYKAVDKKAHSVKSLGKSVSIPVSARIETGALYRAGNGVYDTYFIENKGYFDRAELYNTVKGDYSDNIERFAFFNLAVLEAIRKLDMKPDLIHVNDWQTSLIPVYLKARYRNDPALGSVASLLTIHNLGYQGRFDASQWHLLGLKWDELYNVAGLEYFGQINLLKGGILFADMISTVSETYAQEIQRPDQGAGLDGLLRGRSSNLFGVLNGIDDKEWNPAIDPLITARYSDKDLGGKKICKEKLLEELKLAPGPQPVLAMVTRLTGQKGIDLLLGCLDRLMRQDIKLVILGSGQRKYEKALRKIGSRYPGKASARVGFDSNLSHRIIAGSDIFLMPSRYEPCGLTQMYSLAYGAAPLVRATGGLNDTVTGFDPKTDSGNGFEFKEYTQDALYRKICEAIDYFNGRPEQWVKLIKRGMRENHSWAASARKYEKLYKRAIGQAGK